MGNQVVYRGCLGCLTDDCEKWDDNTCKEWVPCLIGRELTERCDGKGNLERYIDVDQTEAYPCPGCPECAPEPELEPGRVGPLPAHGLDLPGLMTLCCFYDSHLACFEPIRADAESRHMDVPVRLEHVRWMLTEMLTMTNTEKMNRWLGFVQAVLWCGGVFTVDELRKHVQEVATA